MKSLCRGSSGSIHLTQQERRPHLTIPNPINYSHSGLIPFS